MGNKDVIKGRMLVRGDVMSSVSPFSQPIAQQLGAFLVVVTQARCCRYIINFLMIKSGNITAS